jgi:molybdopterin/thiamine biosynthesis adenylyltransferase/rhodanese-related sulfurtransferase
VAADFSPEETVRYSRQTILPEVGLAGQEKLKNAKILLVGLGGLGSPAALYLAASGVGCLGLVDFDQVDLSNLQRQVIHPTTSVGELKTASARASLLGVNPHVKVRVHDTRLTAENALEIVEPYDLVLDGTDNFATRYLVNDACVLLGKPNVYGAIYRFEGQASVFCTGGGPCYRCLFPEPPPAASVPNCAEAGVLGVLPGMVGIIQATEAVKLILGIGRSLVGRLLLYSALDMSFRELTIRRNPDCPICGDRPTIQSLMQYKTYCSSNEPDDTVHELDSQELRLLMESSTPFSIVDVREPKELEIGKIEGSSLIPLGQLAGRTSELDPDRLTVFYCRSGFRSLTACNIAKEGGITNVASLSGGILEWLKGV